MSIPTVSLDRISWFMGETARPYSLFAAASSALVATILTAIYNPNAEGALFVAACWAGVGGLYHSKSWEEQKKTGQAASVEIAKAQNTTGAE